jgi:hypothetical protein
MLSGLWHFVLSLETARISVASKYALPIGSWRSWLLGGGARGL